MNTINRYLSLIKFSHTIFAMPFALIGFFLGLIHVRGIQYENNIVTKDQGMMYYFLQTEMLIKLILVILCMIFARSAAMAFNRWLDKHFDAMNPRTAIREIPAGLIKANHALLFVLFSCLAFVICCWYINKLCFYLSFIALFIILFYSYTKRFTALCHLVLGAGLSLAPIGAYLAVTGEFNMLPVLFSLTVLCWVSGFDIIYALQDEEFDRSNKLHSIPAAMGKKTALKISEILHALSGILIILAGLTGAFGNWYWAGALLFIGMLFYQHSVVKHDDLRRVNLAFMTANGIASVIFAVFVIMDLFIKNL